MKQLSKMISLLLVVVMCFGMIATVNAAEVQSAGGTGTTPVTLTVAAATFSVTVPTALPVTVLADGAVVAPDAVKIVNNSAGSVKVANVAVEGQNDWTIVDFGTDPDSFKVDEKKVGLQINTMTEITADDGTFAFDATKWSVMTATDGQEGGDDECEFIYDAILAPQSTAIADAVIANVVFTIDWHRAGAAELIAFTMCGCDSGYYELAAENGMTWEQWLASDYSTYNYYNNNDGIEEASLYEEEDEEEEVTRFDLSIRNGYVVCGNGEEVKLDDEYGEAILATDKIIDGQHYCYCHGE